LETAALFGATHPETPFPNPLIDLRFDNLLAFATALP